MVTSTRKTMRLDLVRSVRGAAISGSPLLRASYRYVLGWQTGLEPATTGITIRDSTS